MASQVPLANGNHILLRIRISRSWVKNNLIQILYEIKYILVTLGNPTSKYISERINQVLRNTIDTHNLQENCVNKDHPLEVILAASAFYILSIQHIIWGKNMVHLIFSWYNILPMKDKAGLKINTSEKSEKS